MKTVKARLSPLPGVAEVNVDFPNRLAHCKLDSGDFDVENAITILAEEGYKATLVESTN